MAYIDLWDLRAVNLIFSKMPIFGFLIPCLYGLENDGGKTAKESFYEERQNLDCSLNWTTVSQWIGFSWMCWWLS
jgi:hypothetical protein